MEDKINLDLEDLTSEPFLEAFMKNILDQDPVFLTGALVAVMVVIMTIVFLKVFLGSQTARNTVLLVGLCDAGKTLLFSRLLTGKFTSTVTSSTENSAWYRTKSQKSKSWTLVDVPGHDSLRPQVVEKFKASARALVFVVDSAAFQKEVKDVAEFLYSLLSDGVVMKNSPSVLIVCNKQDVTTAKSAKLIQQQLEKELTMLRVTRSAALSSQDGSVKSTLHLGKRGKDFEFAQLPIRVEFVECSARGSGDDGDADVQAVEDVLARL